MYGFVPLRWAIQQPVTNLTICNGSVSCGGDHCNCDCAELLIFGRHERWLLLLRSEIFSPPADESASLVPWGCAESCQGIPRRWVLFEQRLVLRHGASGRPSVWTRVNV